MLSTATSIQFVLVFSDGQLQGGSGTLYVLDNSDTEGPAATRRRVVLADDDAIEESGLVGQTAALLTDAGDGWEVFCHDGRMIDEIL